MSDILSKSCKRRPPPPPPLPFGRGFSAVFFRVLRQIALNTFQAARYDDGAFSWAIRETDGGEEDLSSSYPIHQSSPISAHLGNELL